MQTGPDLVSAGYPTSRPLAALLGGLTNSTQPNLPARTNLDFGLGNLSDGAAATSGVAIAVPVPVQYGDVITKVSVLAGATAASVPTHQWAALYAGTGSAPALLAQSTDATSAAVAASGVYALTGGLGYTIKTTDCPNGFVYVSILFAATTAPTLVSVATPAGANYQWSTNGPLFLGATHGSSLAATAPATIASPSAKAVSPVVILT